MPQDEASIREAGRAPDGAPHTPVSRRPTLESSPSHGGLVIQNVDSGNILARVEFSSDPDLAGQQLYRVQEALGSIAGPSMAGLLEQTIRSSLEPLVQEISSNMRATWSKASANKLDKITGLPKHEMRSGRLLNSREMLELIEAAKKKQEAKDEEKEKLRRQREANKALREAAAAKKALEKQTRAEDKARRDEEEKQKAEEAAKQQKKATKEKRQLAQHGDYGRPRIGKRRRGDA